MAQSEEFAFNVDVDLIPGSGRSLEKEKVTHFSILACEILWTEERSLAGCSSWYCKIVRHDLRTKQQQMFHPCPLCWEFLWYMLDFFQILFYAPIGMIIWFVFFHLIMWYITLTDSWILNCPWHIRINPTWSWCMIFLFLLNLVCWCFVEGFCICVQGLLFNC